MELGKSIRVSVMASIVTSRTEMYIDTLKLTGNNTFDQAESNLFNNPVTSFTHEIRRFFKRWHSNVA
jgi:streptomycin 6-kinase